MNILNLIRHIFVPKRAVTSVGKKTIYITPEMVRNLQFNIAYLDNNSFIVKDDALRVLTEALEADGYTVVVSDILT